MVRVDNLVLLDSVVLKKLNKLLSTSTILILVLLLSLLRLLTKLEMRMLLVRGVVFHIRKKRKLKNLLVKA
jgi:hypothetical protein